MEVYPVGEVCVEAHHYRHKGNKHHTTAWVSQYLRNLMSYHYSALYDVIVFFSLVVMFSSCT